jgi:hypothetical protein
MFAMILLDGTPGPTVPSFIHSAKPRSMKILPPDILGDGKDLLKQSMVG